MTHQDSRINEALRTQTLDLPAELEVVDIAWRIDEDSSNEESLEVYVILADSTTDSQIEKGPITLIKRKIIESLRNHEIELFPYFHFLRERERYLYEVDA